MLMISKSHSNLYLVLYSKSFSATVFVHLVAYSTTAKAFLPSLNVTCAAKSSLLKLVVSSGFLSISSHSDMSSLHSDFNKCFRHLLNTVFIATSYFKKGALLFFLQNYSITNFISNTLRIKQYMLS